MEEKKVSVIIPCYNVERYLDRCMDSVVKQTLGIENMEIILVNDASTDGTFQKIQEWESRYPDEIMAITYEENLRQGGARNVGLQYATGEYVGFVDADDWIEPDMYEVLYGAAKKGDYDQVCGKYVRNFSEDEPLPCHTNSCDHEYHFQKKGDWYISNVEDFGNVGEKGGITVCLYRRSIIIENAVFFPEKLAYEDNYWSAILSLYIKDLYVVDRVLYHYFVNMQSTVTTRNGTHHLDRLAIELGLLSEYKQRGVFEYNKDEIEWRFIRVFYLNTLFIIFTRFDYIPDVFNFMKEKVLENFPDFRKNPLIKERENARNELLLQLLDFPQPLEMEDLELIKDGYLKSFE